VLGNLGSPSAVPALRALAGEHADPGVRRAAAAALARLESRSPIASQGDRP
jgi:HEAT repeat protein